MQRVSGIRSKTFTGMALVLLCGLTLSSSHSLSAQQGLRDLSGSVEDGQHEPLRGAVVYLEDGNTHGVLTYITDRSGHFSFKRLRGDVDYDVWAAYRGQNSKHRTLSQFDTNPSPVLVLTIKHEQDQ